MNHTNGAFQNKSTNKKNTLFCILVLVFLGSLVFPFIYEIYRKNVITTNEGNAIELLTDIFLVQNKFIEQNTNNNYGTLQELMGLTPPQGSKSKTTSPTIVKNLRFIPT